MVGKKVWLPLARSVFGLRLSFLSFCRFSSMGTPDWPSRVLAAFTHLAGPNYQLSTLNHQQSEDLGLIRQELDALRSEDRLTPDLVRDPYFLDFLGLKDTYAEKDIEAAILRAIESFIPVLTMVGNPTIALRRPLTCRRSGKINGHGRLTGMAFKVRMGVPEMEALWNDLSTQTGPSRSFLRSSSRPSAICRRTRATIVWLRTRLTT